MSTWYYASAERQQLGPVSTDELKQYFHSEQISLDTLVWRDGMLHWRPLHELAQQLGLLPAIAATEVASSLPTVAPPILPAAVIEAPPAKGPELQLQVEPEPAATPASAFTPAPAPAPTPTPAPTPASTPAAAPRAGSEGRAVFNLGTEPGPAPVYTRPAVDPGTVAAASNPYAAGYSNLQEGVLARAQQFIVDAGFWKRVAASAIDGFILGLAGSLFAEVLGALFSDLFSGGQLAELVWTWGFALVLNALYHAWFHSTLMYATPGKMAVGIKVLRSNGEPISFLRALARYFASVLCTLSAGLGYLMAAFTARKQGLHDFICDTVVVDKWAYTNEPERQRTELGTVTVIVLVLYGLLVLLILAAIFMIGLGGMLSRF